jgi:hypothetical protein
VLPPESVVWPPVPLWPPGAEEAEVAPPWATVPAELAAGDVVPPDHRVDESVLVAPPLWPPVWTELPPAMPPVAAISPVPELPPGPVAPPADPSWFTLGALLLQARPIAHANRVETSLVFMGVGVPVSVTDLKAFFTLKHRNSGKTPSREMSLMWDLLSPFEPDAGKHSDMGTLKGSHALRPPTCHPSPLASPCGDFGTCTLPTTPARCARALALGLARWCAADEGAREAPRAGRVGCPSRRTGGLPTRPSTIVAIP